MSPNEERIVVVATGHAHPTTALTSDALAEAVPGLEPGWAEKRLGIEERRVASSHEPIAGFAVAAMRDALERAAWSGDQLDAVLCGTSFVDDLLPATASLIARDVAPHAIAFDVNAACASVPYTLAIAESFLRTREELARVAVCVAEHPTMWADYEDRESCVFWGDSAGCALLERGATGPGLVLLGTALVNDATFAEKVRVRRGGLFHHDGRYSREQVLALSEATCRELLERHGVDQGSVAAFVGHQSNIPLLKDLGERMGVDWDRQWHNVSWAGNQGAAGALTALSGGMADHALAPGDHVLLAAVGGGYAGGAALFEWVSGSA